MSGVAGQMLQRVRVSLWASAWYYAGELGRTVQNLEQRCKSSLEVAMHPEKENRKTFRLVMGGR